MEETQSKLTNTSSPTQNLSNTEKQYLNSLAKHGQRGRIELIMGPMFAGKTTELIRRVNRLDISGKKCLWIKFGADTRYSQDCMSTHDK
jgi:thymidine kinase